MIINTSVCPKCGCLYHGHPAASRVDNTAICPDCGIREALASINVPDCEMDHIIDLVHEYYRKGGTDD